MRAAVILTLALPLLLDCGTKGDLIIGELTLVSAGGTASVIPSAGSGAEPNTSGSSQGATSGSDSGGSQADGGTSGGTGGTNGEAGAPEPSGGAPTTCLDGEEPPTSALLHRYDFSGTGATVTDHVGSANGNLVGGATLDGSGVLTLPGNRDGQPDQYLNLPNGLISPLGEVTIVAWTTWLSAVAKTRQTNSWSTALLVLERARTRRVDDGPWLAKVHALARRGRSRSRSPRKPPA